MPKHLRLTFMKTCTYFKIIVTSQVFSLTSSFFPAWHCKPHWNMLRKLFQEGDFLPWSGEVLSQLVVPQIHQDPILFSLPPFQTADRKCLHTM